MHVFIYNLQGTLYEGEASSITLPALNGEISVLPHHAPLLTSLSKGTIRIASVGEPQKLQIEKGFAFVDGQKTIVLAD